MAIKNMTKKQVQTFFERLREQRPHPTTELNFSNPFELLVAVKPDIVEGQGKLAFFQ